MSLPRYAEYRDSGVEWLGEIPSHWSVRRLQDIAQVINGYPFDSKLYCEEGGYPLIRIRDLDADETATRYAGDFVPAAAVMTGDVLIGMDGEFNVGRWLGSEQALLNQRMCCVRPPQHALATFLRHALPAPLRAINDVTYSTTVKHLSSFQVKSIRLALPEDAELEEIARFLDRETAKIDALIAEQENLLALLAEKRQATISHAVTRGHAPNAPMKDSGIAWLGEVPAHWDITRLGVILDAIGDVDHFMPASVEQGVPYLMTGDLKEFVSEVSLEGCKQVSDEDYLALSRKIKSSKGDVIMARYATIGTSMYVDVDTDFLVSYSCVTLKANHSKVSGLYLFQYMRSDAFRQGVEGQVNTNTQGNVGINHLKNISVVLPPITEQAGIAAFVGSETARIDEMKAEAERAITLLRERRSALIAAAVTGKIDVRGAVEREAA
jgi:type I restriction enzyme S subunit